MSIAIDERYGSDAKTGGSSLGEDLRAHREQAGMSVEDMARAIKMPARSVRAVEEGAWREFSARVYAQGVARRMGKAFGAEYGDQCAVSCGREWDDFFGVAPRSPAGAGHGSGASRFFALTPARLGTLAAGGAASVLIGFLAFRIADFAGSPDLVILAPDDRTIVQGPLVRIAGRTEKESGLTLNGREISINQDGNFDTKIEAQSGLNLFQFESVNRFGKKSEAARYIVVQ